MAISISKKFSNSTVFIENYYKMGVAIIMADPVVKVCSVIMWMITATARPICVALSQYKYVVYRNDSRYEYARLCQEHGRKK